MVYLPTDLKLSFYQAFDFAVISDFIRIWKKDGIIVKGKLMGDGSHFQSFLFNVHGEFPLVISISKYNFCSGNISERKRWAGRMKKVKDEISSPLVPPFEIMDVEDAISYIKPYAADPKESISQHWGDIGLLADDFVSKLAEIGMYIDDYLHIKCIRGLPLIIDWSDLKQKNIVNKREVAKAILL